MAGSIHRFSELYLGKNEQLRAKLEENARIAESLVTDVFARSNDYGSSETESEAEKLAQELRGLNESIEELKASVKSQPASEVVSVINDDARSDTSEMNDVVSGNSSTSEKLNIEDSEPSENDLEDTRDIVEYPETVYYAPGQAKKALQAIQQKLLPPHQEAAKVTLASNILQLAIINEIIAKEVRSLQDLKPRRIFIGVINSTKIYGWSAWVLWPEIQNVLNSTIWTEDIG